MHNKALLSQMPDVYRHPSQAADATTTGYIGFVGETAVLGNQEGRRFADMTDGTSNSLLVIEAKTAIPWTKPQDVSFNPKSDLEIVFFDESQVQFAMADGSVREMKPIDIDLLKKMITVNGGETIPRTRR